jgi:hypothetical protein
MTTKTARGRIRTPGVVGLSCEASYAAEEGDPVHITGPYTVAKADGTKKVIGIVAVENKGRVGSSFPASIVPGPVTVDAFGYMVVTVPAGGTVAAGDPVGVNGSGAWVTVVDDAISQSGTALTGATVGLAIDVLCHS